MSRSPNLSMPYIQPSQAQKHVTHNQAIEMLDALVHLRIAELAATAPPADPADGQVTGVGPGAGGAFAGQDGNLACRANGGWLFVTPANGFTAWVESEAAFHVYRDGAWRIMLAPEAGETEETRGLGINTGWDTTNRLSVASAATLLTHEGAGHQLKLNKAAPPETASLLFQDGFSGRAEIGLAGNDDLSIKVSPDGAAWSTALSVDAGSGETTLGGLRAAAITGEAVQSRPDDTTPGRLMRADWGYGPGNAVGPVSQAGGTPTGAVIESGQTGDGAYTRWADGTQICKVGRFRLDRVADELMRGIWTFPRPFAGERPVVIHMVNLVASDTRVDRRDWGIQTAVTSLEKTTMDLYSTRGAAPIPEGDSVLTEALAVGRWF